MAVRQGTRLKELIEQLLLAARFEQTGREPAERPLVDAAALARDALAAARVAHPARELVLVAGEPLPVLAAPEAVLQVLGNLLDNAAKFERFTQLDSGATRRAGGVGLGLYIARRLANDQGGELLATDPTPPSGGARFELRLPLAERRPALVLANAASRR